MRRILKEPLLHFLLLGALLFGAHAWLNRAAGDLREGKQVRIGAGEVQWLTQTWRRQWQREPTREELSGLVTAFLKEELLAREARAMKLDENDTVVRRRLAQKMEFLVQDLARVAEPPDEVLRAFHAAHAERFQSEARISFTHIFFSREKRRAAAADAAAALTALQRGKVDTARLGDPLMLEPELHDADVQTVASQFGREFATSVFALKPGSWNGPIESGYGLHLVRVSELKPVTQPDFADVRARVLERWRDQRHSEDTQKYFADLLKKYEVVIDDDVKPLVGTLGAK